LASYCSDFGVVQIGLSLKSHDPSPARQWVYDAGGGVIIMLLEEILDFNYQIIHDESAAARPFALPARGEICMDPVETGGCRVILSNALNTSGTAAGEIWQLVTQSPHSFKAVRSEGDRGHPRLR
jgi:hypothetical protein